MKEVQQSLTSGQIKRYNSSGGLLKRGEEILEQEMLAWRLSRSQALLISVIPILVVLVMTASVPFFRVFEWLTREDSVIEWLQFLFLIVACFLFAVLGIQLLRHKQWIGLLCLLAALGIFFVAGEEIAWGQRIFGWITPQELDEINSQHETTIHNISSAHLFFIYGIMLGGLYGMIMPMILFISGGSRPRSWMNYLLAPPLFLIPAFFVPFAYRFTRLILPLEAWFPRLVFPITKFSEVTELCFYFGLLVFAWLNLRRLNRANPKEMFVRGSG